MQDLQVTVTELPTFRVTGVQPGVRSIDVNLSGDVDLDVLNLYDGQDAAVDAADVTLIGQNVGAVRGSLVWNASSRTLTFLKSGGPLDPDTYTLSLFSRADGLVNVAGELLDGDSNGVPGGDFSTSFTVDPSTDRLLFIPDIVRGPGQPVNVPATSTGIPVSIDNANGLTQVDFTLQYDSALLDITAVTLASGLPGDWMLTTADVSTPGQVVVSLAGTTPLSAGSADLAVLTAEVPFAAEYGDAQLLRFQSTALNQGAIGVRASESLHTAVYFGDATGNGSYSALDASLISRTAVGLDTGFDAFDRIDPVLIGDVTGNGSLSALDASFVSRKAVGLPQPEIPDLPPAPPLTSPNLESQSPLAIDTSEVVSLSEDERLAALHGEPNVETSRLQQRAPQSLGRQHCDRSAGQQEGLRELPRLPQEQRVGDDGF
ncbi:MAG: hypothetical protein IH899_02235, partial [Planctomycetes bacterium]|nr:hypothetical protein [Planctomycetota bacterium]